MKPQRTLKFDFLNRLFETKKFVKYLHFIQYSRYLQILSTNYVYLYREKLQLEIAAREKAEKKQQEYEEKIKTMQDDLEKRQQDLQEAKVSAEW